MASSPDLCALEGHLSRLGHAPLWADIDAETAVMAFLPEDAAAVFPHLARGAEDITWRNESVPDGDEDHDLVILCVGTGDLGRVRTSLLVH